MGDGMMRDECLFLFDAERRPLQNDGPAQWRWLGLFLDHPRHTTNIGCFEKGADVFAANGHQGAGPSWQRLDRVRDVRNDSPAVAVLNLPWRPLQPQQGNARHLGCRMRMGGDLRREGMRGIDHGSDPLSFEIGHQPGYPAETAAPHMAIRQQWIFGNPGQRRNDLEPLGQQPRRQLPRLARAAKDEDAVIRHGRRSRQFATRSLHLLRPAHGAELLSP